jgi:3-oxoacid CoA-transferase B subunit
MTDPNGNAAGVLTLQDMAARVAQEFREGMIVNLGGGMPTSCSNAVDPELEVFFHSEQGVLGFGAVVRSRSAADPYLINASRQCVLPRPGMVLLDHAESFALARGGRVDISVIGAFEVSQAGDLANSKLPGRPSGMIGGAQDFAFCAKTVIVMMRSQNPGGQAKLVRKCSLPVTAPGVVSMIVTELGVFVISPSGFVLTEIAPGIDVADIVSSIDGDICVMEPLPAMVVSGESGSTKQRESGGSSG